MTGTAQSAAQIIKQAYIVSAHAMAQRLGLQVGDKIAISDYLQPSNDQGPKRTVAGRSGELVPGCSLTTTTTNPHDLYGSQVEFRGINADGDVMVRNRGKDVPVPYNFIRQIHGGTEAQRANLRLNDSYTGTVLGDGSQIAVGCQRFKTDKIRELLTLADKTAADLKAAAAKRASAVVTLTASPTATYSAPAPKAAKATKTATTAVKKAPAKKATKRVVR